MRLSSILSVLAASVFAYFLLRPKFSVSNLEPSLAGQVAIVTGASRGLGKGIAVGLGEVGATVYVTGRTLDKSSSNTGGVGGSSQAGSLHETCELVTRAGGKCIPVAVDNGDDKQLEQLFEKVMKEQGRLDILVNNAFSAVSWLPKTMGKAFWEKGVETWDIVNNVGLRSHYVASLFAAQRMSPAKRGLIVNIGSFGGIDYIFDVAYGIGKAGMDRMANDMAIELATENITMVSMWPGLVKTENVEDGALEGQQPHRGRAPGSPEIAMTSLLSSPLAETPLLTGRALATFARDVRKMDYSGKVLFTASVAAGYGLVDERGVRSPPFTSIKFLASVALAPVLKSFGIFDVPGGCYQTSQGLSDLARFYWNTLPDLSIPSFLVKLGAGAPNLL